MARRKFLILLIVVATVTAVAAVTTALNHEQQAAFPFPPADSFVAGNYCPVVGVMVSGIQYAQRNHYSERQVVSYSEQKGIIIASSSNAFVRFGVDTESWENINKLAIIATGKSIDKARYTALVNYVFHHEGSDIGSLCEGTTYGNPIRGLVAPAISKVSNSSAELTSAVSKQLNRDISAFPGVSLYELHIDDSFPNKLPNGSHNVWAEAIFKTSLSDAVVQRYKNIQNIKTIKSKVSREIEDATSRIQLRFNEQSRYLNLYSPYMDTLNKQRDAETTVVKDAIAKRHGFDSYSAYQTYIMANVPPNYDNDCTLTANKIGPEPYSIGALMAFNDLKCNAPSPAMVAHKEYFSKHRFTLNVIKTESGWSFTERLP
ncbi:MAG: hypothetical protein ACYCY8_08780 [Burkholderiales bacterium]